MPPKKVSVSSKTAASDKRKLVRTTIAFKKEIIPNMKEVCECLIWLGNTAYDQYDIKE